MTLKNPTPKPTGIRIEDFGNGVFIKWMIYA